MSVAFVSIKVGRELKEIGLTEYECMAYLALVKYGELTAGQVSENTSIPYSKVYTVLDSLEKKGWIEIRSHARGYQVHEREEPVYEGPPARSTEPFRSRERRRRPLHLWPGRGPPAT